MANPKYKTSRSKTRRRRSHIKLRKLSLVRCPNCKSWKLPHRVCPVCGYYKGKEILAQAQESE